MPADDEGSLLFQQLSQRGLVLGWLRRSLVRNESRRPNRANPFAGHLANRLAGAEGLFLLLRLARHRGIFALNVTKVQ